MLIWKVRSKQTISSLHITSNESSHCVTREAFADYHTTVMWAKFMLKTPTKHNSCRHGMLVLWLFGPETKAYFLKRQGKSTNTFLVLRVSQTVDLSVQASMSVLGLRALKGALHFPTPSTF